MLRNRAKNPDLRRAGFTLVEMLVAIAIIGILIVMVVSVSNSVRTRSLEEQTRSDVKVLMAAVRAYRDMTEELPADATSWNSSAGENQKKNKAQSNMIALYTDLAKREKTHSMLRDHFTGQIVEKGNTDTFYIVDRFPASGDERMPLNYLHDGGAGGAAVVISAGADGLWDTADDIRSDDLRVTED